MKDKVALITGGTKGIGLGIAKSLLENGVKVAITGRDQSLADDIANLLKQEFPSGDVLGIACDVRDYASQEACVAKIVAEYGKLDISIANAGLGHFAPVSDISIEQWNDVIDTNVTGVFYTTKASLPQLEKNKGYLITIASLAGTNFFPNGSAYNASKFAVVGFTQAVMLDVRDKDVKVTTIMPGSVSTHFNGNTPSEADAWKIQPEDLGQMVVDLLRMNPRTLPSKIEVRPAKARKK